MNWDDHAAGWDGNEAVRAYAKAAFTSLKSLCDRHRFILEEARVCDFGCGTGLLTEQLAPLCVSVEAVDASPKMIEVLNRKIQKLGLSTVSASTTSPLDSESAGPYDLIVCSSVCAFLDDYPDAVKKLASCLNPGAWFVQWDWEIEPNSEEPFGLSKDQVRMALQNAGLASVEVDTAFEVNVEGETMRPLMGAGQKPSAS